jgi:phosphatidylglycerophosphate synthase
VSEHKTYSYSSSVKSSTSDELINTYLIRPLAGIVVRMAYHTSITPNVLTIASTTVGIVAAFFYSAGSAHENFIAGLCITLKDILDSADGQLARAKQQYSRAGRFLDSIGDLLVNLLAFGAIGFALYRSSDSLIHLVLGALAFLGTTLRVSYHVFYQTSFLHLQEQYGTNRVTEEVREEDLLQQRLTLRLQRIFQFLYGWQDRMVLRLDAWCQRGLGLQRGIVDGGGIGHHVRRQWYCDRTGIFFSGLLGLGTELFFLTLFSLLDELEAYLFFNLLALNAVWLVSVAFRKFILAPKLTATAPPAR